MLRVLDDFDWQEAFEYGVSPRGAVPTEEYDLSDVKIEDVAVVLWMDEGENDGPDWIIAGVLNDNRGFFLSAGCDYTGWDCQAGGEAVVCNSIEEMLMFAIDDGNKDRFGIYMLGHESINTEDIYDVD